MSTEVYAIHFSTLCIAHKYSANDYCIKVVFIQELINIKCSYILALSVVLYRIAIVLIVMLGFKINSYTIVESLSVSGNLYGPEL